MPRGREFAAVATPGKSPMKIPLNDDRQEKAKRMHNRQALHEVQMNQIKAAATPVRKRKSLGGTPRTPADDDDDGMRVSGSAVTPMKRMPILANFEEWMKMATDNKINATNSWNFALIDYFHDMSLLKEGDGVNFQRASCTLDGCVKIYTSRVDSVATETGRLLSGLADSANKKKNAGQDEDEDDEDGEEGEEGGKKRKKKTQRSSEATLANSFAQLQLKKMELELSVDPLFKKASADFDEGGAKGLLLNHLAIDGQGRIVFDSSDDVDETAEEEAEEEPDAEKPDDQPSQDIDLSGLASKFFPDLARLDDEDICPSLKNLDMGDPSGAASLPFLQAAEDWRNDHQEEDDCNRSGIFLDDDNAAGFDDDDNLGGFDIPAETGFGEGGEAWAKEAALEPQLRVHTANLMGDGEAGEDGEVGGFEADSDRYAVTLQHGKDHDQENILNYFDQALQKNWAGPEHWRIRRIKDNAKANAAGPTKRKEKEPFEIDFAAPLNQALADALYTRAAASSTISLPKAQWKSKTRNLLPDDKHFNSRQLLRLFLPPRARLGSRQKTLGPAPGANENDPGEMDEAYWARDHGAAGEDGLEANFNADFFQDDGLDMPPMGDDDDDEFADAREHFSPPAEDGAPGGIDGVLAGGQEGAFGAQLITQSRRARPEYVQYARVAKKVDVRRLKEELWKGMAFAETTPPTPQSTAGPPTPTPDDQELRFTEVMGGLQSVYPKQAMADISTSYCFICLLHLANEKGLVINNEENFEDLTIRRDLSADLTSGGD